MTEASDLEIVPLIPPTVAPREVTPAAVIISIFLTILLGAANGYLGLKVGITISASIPAAIIAMGILRFFKHSNVLQTNIVQTAASAGEALTAGVAFTLPALIILGAFPHFDYWTSAAVAAIGGIFGVLFSVPLRRILLKDRNLHFPEGTAIANVLRASTDKAMGLSELVYGSLASAVISFFQIGLKILSDGFTWWSNVGSTVFGFGMGFSPTLIGAGYIIGINTGLAIVTGIVVGWMVALPIIAYIHAGTVTGSASDIAGIIWSQHIRYIGVGALLTGGIWSLIKLTKPILAEISHSMKLRREQGGKIDMSKILRTEFDIPFHYVIKLCLLLAIPLFAILFYLANHYLVGYSLNLQLMICGLLLVFFMVIGFIVSGILAYLAGLIGTSASPMSAFALLTLMLAAFMLIPFTHYSHSVGHIGIITMAIMITVVITAASAISNDTMQDLKAGQYVGATPWKQQVMLMVGVCVAALTLPAVLELLFQAYGIGGVFPHPGMDPSDMLAAPQATIMATVAKAIFAHQVPWNMLLIGVAVGVTAIIIDSMAKRKGESFPVIGVGLGIYLPFAASVPLFLGSLGSYYVNRKLKQNSRQLNSACIEACRQKGLVLACGVVAGAAIMGVILAIPFALKGSADVLAIVGPGYAPIANVASVVVTSGLIFWICRVAMKCMATQQNLQ